MDRRERPRPSDSGARMRAPLERLPAVLLTDAGSASAAMDAPVRAAAAGAATAPERQVWPTGPVPRALPWEAVTRNLIFFSCAAGTQCKSEKKDREKPREPKRWMGEGGTITWRPPIPPLGGLFSFIQKEEGRRQCPTCTSRISEGRSGAQEGSASRHAVRISFLRLPSVPSLVSWERVSSASVNLFNH